MKKLKYFILILIISGSLFFLFGPGVIPEDFQTKEILDSLSDNDVIIIFNSGGWGDTPLEEAEDFAPIIEGIQKTLDDFGYNSVVIPYIRTKNTFLGKITGAKEFLNSFNFSSEILAKNLEFLDENLPDKKIIMAGLSVGGDFVDETMEKISDKTKNSVYAITVGVPFWADTLDSENILHLDNNGKDSLVEGNAKPLLLTLIKAPFKWISSKITGQDLSFSQAIQVPGHEYPWSSPEINSQIISFLENKFR